MITNIEQFLNIEKVATRKPKISDYARIVSAIDQGLTLTQEFIEQFITTENADLIVCLLNYTKLKNINIELDRSNLLVLLNKSISSNSHHLLKIIIRENEKSNHIENYVFENILFKVISDCENYKGILLVRLLAEKINLKNIDQATGYPLWALYILCSKQPEIIFILYEMITEKYFLLVTNRFPGILNAWCSRFDKISTFADRASLIVHFFDRNTITLENLLKLGGPKLINEQGGAALERIADQNGRMKDTKKYILELADILLRYGASGQEAMKTAMLTHAFGMIDFLQKKGIVPSEKSISDLIDDLQNPKTPTLAGFVEEIEEDDNYERAKRDPHSIHFYTVKMVSRNVSFFVYLDYKDFAKSLRTTHFLNQEWAEKNFKRLRRLLNSGRMPYGKCRDKHRKLLNQALIMFVAVGWNPSLCRGLEHIAKHAEDFEIPKTEHRRYIDGILLNCAKIGDIETIRLMIETGLRFRGDKEFASLVRIIRMGHSHGHDDIMRLLIPLLEQAETIKNALISYKEKSSFVHEGWFEQQRDMRIELFKAITINDQDKIIRLVSNGANLNFCGLCTQIQGCSEFFNIGIDGIHPLSFVCTRTMDENTCISIFQLLIDLGANIHSANEFSLLRCGQDVKNVVLRINDKNLLHRHIILAELKQENPCKRKEFLPFHKLKQQELKAEKEALSVVESSRWLAI